MHLFAPPTSHIALQSGRRAFESPLLKSWMDRMVCSCRRASLRLCRSWRTSHDPAPGEITTKQQETDQENPSKSCRIVPGTDHLPEPNTRQCGQCAKCR